MSVHGSRLVDLKTILNAPTVLPTNRWDPRGSTLPLQTGYRGPHLLPICTDPSMSVAGLRHVSPVAHVDGETLTELSSTSLTTGHLSR